MTTNLRSVMEGIRAARHLSLRVMAKMLEYSPSYLSAIENGKRSIPKNFLQKMKVLDLNIFEERQLIDIFNASINNTDVEEIRRLLVALSTQLAI